jgi:hypothetical protein
MTADICLNAYSRADMSLEAFVKFISFLMKPVV